MTERIIRCVIPGCGTPDAETGARVPRVALTGAYICGYHRHRLTQALREIPDQYAHMAAMDPSSSSEPERYGSPRAKHADPPAPVRLDVLAMLDPRTGWIGEGPLPVADMLASWCCLVAEECRTEQPTAHVTSTTAFLTRHVEWIVEQPWIDDLYHEVNEALAQLRQATGLSGPRKIGTCYLWTDDERCDGDLIQKPDLTTECRRCGEKWETPRERAILTVALASSNIYSTSTESA